MMARQSLHDPAPPPSVSFCFFFFNDTATTEIYTLSLHDALPISPCRKASSQSFCACFRPANIRPSAHRSCAIVMSASLDRKSTRLNSSHSQISYAVFCLKKKKKTDYAFNNETLPD